MMKTMIPPQVGMRLWTLQKEKKEKNKNKKKIKKERPKKREGPKKKKEKKQKNERKREKGQCYYPFTTLVLQSSTMFFI